MADPTPIEGARRDPRTRARADKKPEFSTVLRTLWEASGLTQEHIAEQSGITVSDLGNWLGGRMPTHDNFDVVAGLERILDVEPGTLSKPIRFRSRRGHAKQGRYERISDSPHNRARVMRGMSPADMRLPPAEFARKYHKLKVDRFQRNDPVTLSILASRQDAATAELPLSAQLSDEIEKFRELSTVIEVDEFLPLKRRQDGGAEMEAVRMTAVMKFLAHHADGPLCAIDDLTLGHFMFPKVVQKAVSAKQGKMKAITGEQYLTNVDVAHFTTGKNLVSPPSGFVYQMPELFLPRLRSIEGLVTAAEINLVSRDWQGACERAAKRYSDLRSSFGQFVTRSVDRKHPVDLLLDHPDPLFALDMLNERMAQAFHTYDPNCPYWLTLTGNCVISRIQSDCAFRDRTLHLLNTADLRECGEVGKLLDNGFDAVRETRTGHVILYHFHLAPLTFEGLPAMRGCAWLQHR
jgi:transcriptional regulator with XRE-family HTH domain